MDEAPETSVDVAGGPVRITHPDKLIFPEHGWTKLDVVEHYAAVAAGALRGVYGRPTVLKRWPQGLAGEPFFQKRAPKDSRCEYATVRFPSGRSAELLVPRSEADVVWMAQLNCLDLNPWPVRADDLDHPDELRVDLDPTPETGFDAVRAVARTCGDVLAEHGLVGQPKTSGARGLHILARIAPRWTFHEVRRAALALGREVERRRPAQATTAWWKEQRHGVFVDYNQNARDRTVASAHSVRQTGLISAPLAWDEVEDVEPADFALDRYASQRYARVGDLTSEADEAVGSLESLLALATRDEQEGLGDAPWPPHFPKQVGEQARVEPSRRRPQRSSGE